MYTDDMEITPAQTCEDFFALFKHIKLSFLKVAEQYDLTPAQFGVLFAINSGHATMGEIACTLACDASNVTGIIDRLVAHKLVDRQENNRDRRAKTLRLTMKGRRITKRILAKLSGVLGCQRLSQAERLLIGQIIGKLSAT